VGTGKGAEEKIGEIELGRGTWNGLLKFGKLGDIGANQPEERECTGQAGMSHSQSDLAPLGRKEDEPSPT
jgi:hypothetical protein